MMALLPTYTCTCMYNVGKDKCVHAIIDTHLSSLLDHDVVVTADSEKLPSSIQL